jgi:HAE1 family hydrophobic/amphiphilic exporter-1
VKGLYGSPLRVYLCLGALAATGLYVASLLPVSLFPNSSKPTVHVSIGYGGSTAREFLNSYGYGLETHLQRLTTPGLEVEKLTAEYGKDSASYTISFKWGTAPALAQRETETSVLSYAARFPKEVRDSIGVNQNNENSGFFAASFFSETRSLDDLYKLIEPQLTPKLSKVLDAQNAGLWNPNAKEVRVELIPEKIAALKIFPLSIQSSLESALQGFNGGSITQGTQSLQIQFESQLKGIESLSRLPVEAGSGIAHLSDIARIDFGPVSTGSQVFKTNSVPSLILFAQPKAGGNVKNMAEEIMAAVDELKLSLPPDVEYRVLVDPSDFIRSAIQNVFHEVAIGAFLAVVILFVFIGSFKNVITAAIEIPLSMILAFILMKISGMHLNIISLGGLALSAGMNVDASVVVMENIFRRFEKEKGALNAIRRLEVLVEAVNEVRFAVISSTIASLVVFFPLIFTSNLSSAVLGDLAKTVVFSHGMSAIVALLLVPTVRLQLMSIEGAKFKHPTPLAERWIQALENNYAHALSVLLDRKALRAGLYISVTAILIGSAILIVPRLPKEVIGKPDTDWVTLGMWTKGNTLVRQMETQAEEVEARFLDKFGSDIQYTFTQIHSPNSTWMMARLKDKSRMREIKQAISDEFQNTPFIEYWADTWNPAELPLPNPPQLRVAVRGGTPEARVHALQFIDDSILKQNLFEWTSTEPSVTQKSLIRITPHAETALTLEKSRGLSLFKLADLLNVATLGKRVGSIPIDGKETPVVLRFPDTGTSAIQSVEDVAALPIAVDSKIIPLKALAAVDIVEAPPAIFRENGKEVSIITARAKDDRRVDMNIVRPKTENILSELRAKLTKDGNSELTLQIEDSEKDLTDAIHQLTMATGLSIALIFLTLLIQFGSLVSAALVLVAIPLGMIGVLLSLFVFESTLSLNSILGVILLNGIAVANSILLVDFTQRLVNEGMPPRLAAISAARQRLRPILITSLTTILGMMPIALGFGEGGRILQPLGIAVSGGLWLSMSLTLFIVPSLHVSALSLKRMKKAEAPQLSGSEIAT